MGVAAIMHTEPAMEPKVMGPVEPVLRRCLAKDPGDRWQNAADLKWALEHLRREPAPVSHGPRLAWAMAALFAILPFLAGILAIAGAIYCVYLWYLGLGPIKKTPEDKKVVYLIVTFLALIVVYALIGMILSRLLLPVFGIGYGAYGM